MNKLPEHIRRSIKRAIEDSKRGMQLNDGKQRVTLPGGTLEYLMHLIDWDAAPQVAGLPEESVEEDVYYSIAALMKPYVLAECSASENSLPASVFEAFEHLLKFWLKHKQHVAAQPPAGQAQEQPAQAAQAAPQGWREFIEECAKHSGRMVYGNNLAQHAQLLLASQSTAHPAQAQDVCSNCIGTGIEKGVYKNHPCAFCADHPSQSTAAQEDEPITYTVDGEVMTPFEYIDYLHGKLDAATSCKTTFRPRDKVAAMLPNGASVTNVYAAYAEGLKQAAGEVPSNQRLFVTALMLQKTEPGRVASKLTLHWNLTDSEENAIGRAVKFAADEFPEYSVASHLCHAVPEADIAKAALSQSAKENGDA